MNAPETLTSLATVYLALSKIPELKGSVRNDTLNEAKAAAIFEERVNWYNS